MLIALAVMQTGCSTLADAKAGRGTGRSRVYDHGFDEVWDAAVEVIFDTSLDLVSEDKANGTILAQRGMTGFSYGEDVAVFVEEFNGEVRTRVEVVSKRALATNITAPNWEPRILRALDRKLGCRR